VRSQPGRRGYIYGRIDALSGWIAVALIGLLTGFVASLIDVTEATISDWKFGFCSTNIFKSKETCCRHVKGECILFQRWSESLVPRFCVYLFWACIVGVISSSITMLSKTDLPNAMDYDDPRTQALEVTGKLPDELAKPKSMYLSAGAGVPEIKTILAGFNIPGFLSFKTLVLKATGAIFAVASGLPLGKEAPLIHIGTAIANLVGEWFPKYRDNGRQMRELLIAGSAAGITSAFGAPIGGVLFAYEELSVYFPRKALYRTFLCSIAAAVTLKLLDPFGTGRLVLFEVKYNTSYTAVHYATFVFLGVAGGIWGGTFTRLNFLWARWFRSFSIIKKHPIFEVFIVTAVVACLQFPDPATRHRYDTMIRLLLTDCKHNQKASWVCEHELGEGDKTVYTLLLLYGTIQVLATTTITAGIKLPSGIIMPALAGGALFGRFIGQFLPHNHISPGIFAMVGAGAFLSGITRMTISLCVIMFELTGELEYVLPHMIAILCAKWVADAISRESIYDLTQVALGHPFLSPGRFPVLKDIAHLFFQIANRPLDEAIHKVTEIEPETARVLLPPRSTMEELTVMVPNSNKVSRKLLVEKLAALKRRGLMDSGLVLVQGDQVVQGYIAQTELEFGLHQLGAAYPAAHEVRLLGTPTDDNELDLARFVNRAPICVCVAAPIEVVVAIFTQLGVRYICLTEEGTGALVGVVIRKRLMGYLDGLHH
jgi:chloride channel 3/4/5